MRGKIFSVRIIGLLFVSLIFYATVVPEDALSHGHPAHQIIAWKAWFLLPSSDVKTALANYLGAPFQPPNTNYDSGSNITEGTYDEDYPEYEGRWMNHFWNTTTTIQDDPAVNPDYGLPPGYQSAYRRAQNFWDDKVIPYYIGKDKNGNPHEVNIALSFWWLGRVAHLLTDMSVPAHTHNDPHVAYNYETYINKKACPENASCAWCSDITECGSPTVAWSLYELFWHMAELADDYDSENQNGEFDGGARRNCDITGTICTISDEDYDTMGDDLFPEAIRHVAGLYQLFWAAKSISMVTTCDTTPLTIGGDAIFGEISLTDCTSTKHGNGWYADFYTFTGSAGDKISISQPEAQFTRDMVLYGPNGLVVLDANADFRIPNGSGYYTLPATGTYTLEVTTFYAGETGNYTLTSLSSDTTAPTPGIVTPYNMSSGSFVDRPFNLRTTFTDNESTVTSCEYTTDGGTTWSSGVVSGTKPNFTCTRTGINGTDGQTLTLNMRATSGGGTITAAAVTRKVDTQPPTDGTLTLIPSNSQVLLNWTPASDIRSGLRTTNTYKVVKKVGISPNSKCTNGTPVYLGNNNSVVDSDLINGTVYYYRVCAYDKVDNISTGATAKATVNWLSKKLTNNIGNSINPSIAVDGENIYMAWEDDTPGNPEIYFRVSTDGGYTWGAAKKLTNNTGNSANPAIAVNGTNVYVVWQNDTTGNPNMSDIYLRMSADGGNTWAAAKRLTSNAGNSANPSIAVDNLNVYVVWNDDTTGNPEIYFRESNNGGSTWAVPQSLTSNAGDSLNPAIAVNGSNVYVTWEDNTPGNYEVFVMKSTNGGTTWKQTRLTQNAGESANPSITVKGSNIYVAWEDNTPGNYEIFVKRSTDGGTTWKQTRLTQNAGDSLNPAIAANGLNVYVVWQDDTTGDPEIFLKESNDRGNTWQQTRITDNAGNSLNPAIALDGLNAYIVWEDDTTGNSEIWYGY